MVIILNFNYRMKNLIFVSDEWGYTKGGINTINMELCNRIALLYKDIKVYCIVIYADKETVTLTQKSKVKLITLNDTKTNQSKFYKNDCTN